SPGRAWSCSRPRCCRASAPTRNPVPVDGRTPVLGGVGGVAQHLAAPRDGRTAFELMVDASATAAEASGAPGALARTDLVLTPRGTWNDRDPGRAVAKRFGAS